MNANTKLLNQILATVEKIQQRQQRLIMVTAIQLAKIERQSALTLSHLLMEMEKTARTPVFITKELTEKLTDYDRHISKAGDDTEDIIGFILNGARHGTRRKGRPTGAKRKPQMGERLAREMERGTELNTTASHISEAREIS